MSSCIFHTSLITDLILDCYNVSLVIFSIPSLFASFIFYTLLCFHLCPPRACQMAGIDAYPISHFHKSLYSSCKADNYCSDITCGQRVSYKAINVVVAAFFLDILGLPSVLCFCNAYPCQQNFLEHPLKRQPTYSDLGFG